MTRSDCTVYVDGMQVTDVTELSGALELAQQHPSGFVWLGLDAPPPDEMDELMQRLHLPPLAVEDVVDGHQRPKLDLYDDTVFLVVKPAAYDDAAEKVHVGEVSLFLTASLALVVGHAGPDVDRGLDAAVEQAPEMLKEGAASVVHAVLDRIVDGYDAVLDGLEEDVAQTEALVFSAERNNPTQRVYGLKQQVLTLRRAVVPLREVLGRLSEGRVPHVPAGLVPHFRDVHDHTQRSAGRVEGLDTLLDGLLDATLAKVGVQQNEDQRKISAWAAIGLVPTMIAGIYGMNFEHMPELRWRFGYPLVLLVIALVCSGLHRGFRRNGWL